MSASRIQRPPRLKPNSKVALIAPAFHFDKNLFENGRRAFESQFKVQTLVKEDVFERHAYFAGDDERRLNEFFKWLTDPSIDAVMGIRGGYGCARIYPELISRLKRHKNLKPKIVLGYSDMTVVLNGLHQELGWTVFHGPMTSGRGIREPLAIETETLRKSLFTTEPLGAISDPKMKSLYPGQAKGRLVGGCLSLLASSVGTSYDVKTEDCILFLEDVDERPYRIDRMLTQLVHAGKLDGVRGIVFGQMHNCEPPAKSEPPTSTTLAVDAIRLALDEFVTGRGIPVLYDFPAGHGTTQVTFPIGTEVELKTEKPEVVFLESGVS